MKFFTNGLILKKQKYKEKDRIVTVLTGSNGLLRAFVRDAENIKSPKCAGTDTLCYSKLTLSEGRDAYYINEAKPIEQFASLRTSPENVALAQYFCDLCISLCPREQNAEEYISLVMNSIYLLSKNRKAPLIVKACMEAKIASLAGYMPDLIMCNECGEYESKDMVFVPGVGKIVCDICSHEFQIKGIMLPLPAITAFRHIIFSKPKDIYSFELKGDPLEKLNLATQSYIEAITEKKFETLNFYNIIREK